MINLDFPNQLEIALLITMSSNAVYYTNEKKVLLLLLLVLSFHYNLQN